jgi:hypothetical protein
MLPEDPEQVYVKEINIYETYHAGAVISIKLKDKLKKPKKVYILMESYCEDEFTICGVFSTKAKAMRIKNKYDVKCSYDPCSYPGIQCKYILSHGEISFMIFRTGSVLIVGKCENEELYLIYEFIKNIFYNEYINICEENTEIKPIKTKKKIKKTIYINN